eukprot:symbB.v1.2.017106.t1/scaffold1326.1/size125234/7
MLSVLRGTTSILVAWVPHTEGFTSRKHNWILGLLEIMGFVHLNDKYWIWPLEHLKSAKHGKCWAHLQVPSDCPGMLSSRLGEMINVLANCIQAINEKGSAFTGYFPG